MNCFVFSANQICQIRWEVRERLRLPVLTKSSGFWRLRMAQRYCNRCWLILAHLQFLCKPTGSLPLRMALYVIQKNLVASYRVFLLFVGSLFIRHSLALPLLITIFTAREQVLECAFFICLSHLPFCPSEKAVQVLLPCRSVCEVCANCLKHFGMAAQLP